MSPMVRTYGPLGPELDGAIKGDQKHRRSVIEKLTKANSGMSEEDVIDLLEALRDNVYEEQDLQTTIAEHLRGTIAGADVQGAMSLLLFWMFDAAEHKRDITRALLE